MTPNTLPQKPPERSSQNRSRSLRERVDALERDQQLLENTLCGLARRSGLTVVGPCSHCDRAYVLASHGIASCPACRNRYTV